ncbi:alkyl sulfatase dimerization domain-containing protein [Streptomyces sp. NPDC092903]|uniref:alkyl sulfatase dimerization domain-containing protein n=1 Tax=Streptomyces sp. NPDC092903 TaxID=3366017 RepID=UPI003803931D
MTPGGRPPLAEVIELPEELDRKWFNRGYHGTLHHDVRAMFTKELGMGGRGPRLPPPHPPSESARRFFELIGEAPVMAEGRRAVDAGDHRWAAQILHILVFAQPDNQAARDLQADAYEQMDHQAEGPQWRGVFRTAAKELREGVQPATFATASPDTALAMPTDILFDHAAVHLVGDRAAQADLRIGFSFTDIDETWTMRVARGVLNARHGASSDTHLTVTGPKAALVDVLLNPASAAPLAGAGKLRLDGDATVLPARAELIGTFDPDFGIVTP